MSEHAAGEADRQLPVGDEIFLDHVGHFVRDPETASAALARAGFAPTAISVQVAPDPATGTPQPTGTGNVTAMFTRGYMEVLFKTADTPLGREFEASLAGHAGVHLAAFSVADAEGALARLEKCGFRVRPIVNFSRPVKTATGEGKAAFTVARVERGEMAEGRIQILTHRTEDTVWQPRWLTHPNGALGLIDLVVVSADVAEAGERFARFTGRPAMLSARGRSVRLDRGRVELMTPDAFAALLPDLKPPGLPFVAVYAVRVKSLAQAGKALQAGGIPAKQDGNVLIARFPDELGVGAWYFVEDASDLPWRH